MFVVGVGIGYLFQHDEIRTKLMTTRETPYKLLLLLMLLGLRFKHADIRTQALVQESSIRC